MTFEWYQSESTIKPTETCLDWSPRNVYLHRNIRQEEREDIDGHTVTMWIYEEAKLPRADYAIYAAEQTAEDIIAAEQEITEQDLSMMEAEQEITDLDLRLMEIENAQEGANDEA